MIKTFYNSYFKNLGEANIDFSSDTIKVALLSSSYTPNFDTHENFDDLTNEVSGTGYTAGGKEITTKSFSQDNANDKAVFDGDDVSWTGSTITARYAVIYKDTGTPSTSPLIELLDFEADEESDSGTFKIEWNADGILDIKQSA